MFSGWRSINSVGETEYGMAVRESVIEAVEQWLALRCVKRTWATGMGEMAYEKNE